MKYVVKNIQIDDVETALPRFVKHCSEEVIDAFVRPHILEFAVITYDVDYDDQDVIYDPSTIRSTDYNARNELYVDTQKVTIKVFNVPKIVMQDELVSEDYVRHELIDRLPMTYLIKWEDGVK